MDNMGGGSPYKRTWTCRSTTRCTIDEDFGAGYGQKNQHLETIGPQEAHVLEDIQKENLGDVVEFLGQVQLQEQLRWLFGIKSFDVFLHIYKIVLDDMIIYEGTLMGSNQSW